MKPSILLVAPSKVFPAETGGHWRTLNVMSSLAQLGYPVTILALAGRREDYEHPNAASYLTQIIEPNLVEVVDLSFKQGIFQSIFRRLGYSKLWSYLAWPMAGASPIANCMMAQKDFLIFDSPFVSTNLLPTRKPLALLSHNLEQEITRKGGFLDRFLWSPIVSRVEKHQRDNFDYYLTCAPSDTNFYSGALRNTVELPNGMNPLQSTIEDDQEARWKLELGDSKLTAVFVGSSYQPNLDAFDWIKDFCRSNYQFLHSHQIRIVVVGRVAKNQYDDGVLRITGPVDKLTDYLKAADLSLNPVTWGSGSNIKVFEALASQIPVISTPFGLRGLDSSLKKELYQFESHRDLLVLLENLRDKRSALKIKGEELLKKFRSSILMKDMVQERVLPLIESIYTDAEVNNEIDK